MEGSSLNWFQHELKLQDMNNLPAYFSQGSNNPLDIITVKIKRIIHLILNGVWIDSAKIGRLLNEYQFSQKGSVDDIKKIFDKCLGTGFSDKSLQYAMEESTSESIVNGFIFLGQFIKSPLTVGAILPSSSHLSREITKGLVERVSNIGRHILEVGPGTGTFTREIIRNLKDEDQLDLVEFDERFCNLLNQRFGHLPNVRIHHASITEYKSNHKYDFVISGLPLNGFESSFVEKVYQKFMEVMKEGGKLCYFEYMGLPRIKEVFLTGEKKADLKKVLAKKNDFFKGNKGVSDTVWLNAPPARVCRCEYQKGS